MTEKPKFDPYQIVTDKIIAALEKGTRPWQRPWKADTTSGLPCRVTGDHYQGINVFLLWAAAIEKGYSASYWMTFNQAKKLKASVRKGEKGEMVVYASKFAKEEEDKHGEKVQRMIPFMKAYTVFNVEQIEGLPEKYYPQPLVNDNRIERIDHCDAFFKKSGSVVKHGGAKAFFTPAGDFIQMPEFQAFKSPEDYYSTLGHEHIHWTGHDSRLKRDLQNRFGSEAYAIEELVAEMGSAFLCGYLGIADEPRPDHAQYIAGWLKRLKSDKHAVFRASSMAQTATNFLREKAGEPVPKFVEEEKEAA